MPKSGQLAGPSGALLESREALESGDVVAGRRLAQSVLASTDRPEVKDEARELLRRSDVAWDMLGYGGLAAILLLGLILIAWLRSGH